MLSKIQNVKCIDFDYSSIGWKTKKDSLGIFRIDAALKERIIYRTFANNKIKIDKRNNKNIDKYLLNIRYKKKKEIFIENLTKKSKFFNDFLLCKIDFGDQISEFPINHINIHTKNNNFQVETGPVLLKKNKKFISAFVFFNSINKCQIVPYYPKLGGKIEELKVKIKFFINA